MRIHHKTLTNKAIRVSFFIAIISLLIFGYAVTLKAAEMDIPANPTAADLGKEAALQAKGALQNLRFYNKTSNDAANDSEIKAALSSYYCWYSAKKQKNETLASSCQRRFMVSNSRLTKKYGKPVISADILDKSTVGSTNSDPKDVKASILSDIEDSDLSQSRQEVVTYNNTEKIDQYQYLPSADVIYKRFFGDGSEEAQAATEALETNPLEGDTKDKATTPFGVPEEDLIASTAKPAPITNPARQQPAPTVNPARQQPAPTVNPARQQPATTVNPVRPRSIADTAQESVTAIKIANNSGVTRDNYFEVFFAFDSSSLTEAARRTVDRASKVAASTISKRVAIVGHTDAAGSNEYNNYLSYQRALAVANYMRDKNLGLIFDKIEGQGESQLAIYTKNGVAHPKNRRSEIYLK